MKHSMKNHPTEVLPENLVSTSTVPPSYLPHGYCPFKVSKKGISSSYIQFYNCFNKFLALTKCHAAWPHQVPFPSLRDVG